MFQRGYVRLHRKITANPLWCKLAPAVCKVAMYEVMAAAWRPEVHYDGVREVQVPKGSFVTSLSTVAEENNLSIQQVRDAWAHLERLGFSTHRRTHRYTVVSVRKYYQYQPGGSPENTEENTDCVPEHSENTVRTESEHSPNENSRVLPANSFVTSASFDSVRRPLKEEEVKKGKKATTAEAAAGWPLTLRAAQAGDPATGAEFVVRLARETVAVAGPMTDAELAKAVKHSYRTGPRDHGAGLLLSRVPAIAQTWALERQEELAARASAEADRARQAQEMDYAEWCDARVREMFEALPAAERTARVAEKGRGVRQRWALLPAGTVEDLARREVEMELRAVAGLPGLEEWMAGAR